jgi:hypothetical protein
MIFNEIGLIVLTVMLASLHFIVCNIAPSKAGDFDAHQACDGKQFCFCLKIPTNEKKAPSGQG